MYAISHAATALVLKRRYPTALLWPLLISVQAVELLWVLFTYLGIEHIAVVDGKLTLGFIPYSHSVGSGIAVALIGAAIVKARGGDRRFAIAVALGVFSHIVLDIIQHEPDIYLLPIARGPRLGLGLDGVPLANLLVELAYGVACWRIYRGGRGLLIGIVAFNLLDAPMMFRSAKAVALLGAHPALLTTIVLVQIVASWVLVAKTTADYGLRTAD